MRTLFVLKALFIFTSIFSQVTSEFSKDIENDITNFIESKKQFYNSPNIAVAITDENNTIYLKHFGNGKKGDRYLIGSMSKSFTALLTLILEEKGVLNINDPVHKFLKWFTYKNKKISDQVTIKDLLQHTSGISTEIGNTFLESNSDFDYTQYYTETLKKIDLIDSSELRYKYSNANYRLLGLIIENATGKSYKECLETYITKPLNLDDTSASITPKLIDSYQYFLYYPSIKFNKSFHRQEIPSGLISSSANDMSNYLRNLMNSYNNNTNSTLNSNSIKQLFTANEKSNYGFGWRIVNDIFYHYGTNKSFESSMYILPSINKAIVVLINSNQAPDAEIIDGIASILLNQKFKNKSSFKYYRNLPFIVFVLALVFLIQFMKWKRLKFPIQFSKKILPNLLLILGLIICITFINIFPKLNGVDLKTAIQFDPASGYSLILISLFLSLTFLLNYFSTTAKT
ncbi:serine hydrolase [uncultured Tenacibaculum sp.]|uniref:serine hydrolase domain-containing protein n=1 Tax=uncultured Tenacibaculum sp. TaxID=174713 RepID=UPI002625E49C|nr:serine hydrolase domain-containing protein [uncultured Tenacibaculum sp.]